MKRLIHASVWGRNGVPPEDWRYRGLYRWVLPLTDTFFFWFGAAGFWNGINTVEAVSSQTWQEYWSLGIALAAFVAFVGVAFPALWLVELIGKIPLVGLVSVYVVIFAGTGFAGNANMLATAGLICILILLPVWRIGDLGFVAWKRNDNEGANDTKAPARGE